MRLLFLDAYFEPDQIAFTHLENDLIEGLVDAGHEIEIVCPTPTRGISKEIIREYKNRKSEVLYDGRVHVTRFSAPHEGKNPIIRALRYFWCNLRTYQIGKKVNNIDVIFANSTPPTQGWIAGRVARKLRVPFIYSLQDVFPDSLVTTGLAKKDSVFWRIGSALESAIYEGCSGIVVISESIKKNLRQKNVPNDKIEIISNWIDIEKIMPVARENNSLFDEFNLDRDKFIVLYAGNFGIAQGAEIILDAADQLKSEPNIQFVVFGSGSGYQDAAEKAKGLPNIFIHPLLPQERVSEVYSMGDVSIITCKKGVGMVGMPSKTWSIMACNAPIIASFDTESEMSATLAIANGGICVEPEDAKALTNQIMYFFNNHSAEKVNSRKYVEKYASKHKCVKAYIAEFEKQVKT